MLRNSSQSNDTGKTVWLARVLLPLAVLLFVAFPALAVSYVTANGHVYLRKSASTDSDVVVVLKPNDRLKVLGQSGDWYQVSFGKKTGYVRNDVVTAEGETKSASTSSTSSNETTTTNTGTATTYNTLKRGSTGTEVFRLQEALIYAGYFDAMPDSSFGEATESAVKNFQADNKLTADGVAGEQTQRLLFNDPAVQAAVEEDNTAASEETAATTYTTLRYGDSGAEVKALQTRLIELGYLTGSATGNFRTDTQTAVKYFQEKNGVTADGIAGKKTQELLYSTTAIAKNPGQLVTVETAGDSTTGALKLGSKGDDVKTLQNKLIELGYLSGKADGTFGTQTETALKLFQQNSSLTADGVAGTKTLNALYSTSATSNSTATSSVLKKDSQGTEVSRLQTQLTSLKYYTGKVTGSFGSLTEKAVIAFQKANGLTADGIAGTTTLNKLYGGSAVANSGSSSSSGTSTATENQPGTSAGSVPSAASVQNVNWYSGIRTKYKAGTVVTVYDFENGLSWKCRFMSNGKHADSEPVTSEDTEIMYRAFGKKNTWTPKAVWVTMPDGKVFIASLHNVPHLSGSIKNNNFDGHLCIHFPREMSEAEDTGPYAVSHQKAIIAGWEKTQKLAGR